VISYSPCRSIGKFLLNNQRQAIKILEEGEMELALLETSQSVSRSDFDSFFQEEQHYISGLVKEPPETTMQIEYVQALDRFYLATYVIPADPKQVLMIYLEIKTT
jgi:predicted Zn-dependent protease